MSDKGLVVIPDILRNARGVTISYLEWVKSRTGYYCSEERVQEDLSRIMRESFQAELKTAKDMDLPLRVAAYTVAIRRVVRAAELRGLYA